MLENLSFTFFAVIPLYVIILIGVIAKRFFSITPDYMKTSNIILFTIAYPALIFSKISGADFTKLFAINEIIVILAVYTIVCLLAWVVAPLFVEDLRDRGAFAQGAFRSDLAIIGLALSMRIYGEEGIIHAAVILSILVPYSNILAVTVLSLNREDGTRISFPGLLKIVITNPIFVAVVIAFPFSFFSIPVPRIIRDPLDYLSLMTLPMALLSMGISLNIAEIKSGLKAAVSAAFIKIFVMPAFLVAVALVFGIEGQALGILFIFAGASAGISGFVMASAMKNNYELASHVILISTLGAIGTLTSGLALLKYLGLA